MANPNFSSPINLNLPQTVTGVPDDIQPTIQAIVNAIRTLQQAIGDLTGANSDSLTYTLSLDLKYSSSLQAQKMQFVVLPTNVTLLAGDFVNIFDSGSGVMKVRKASAAAIATRAHGWVTRPTAFGAKAIIFLLSGYDGLPLGLTPGATYYLSDSSPGGISSAKPVGSGKIVQEVGLALSATELAVCISAPIVLP